MTVFLFVCFFRKKIAEGIDVIYIPCLISLVSLIMPAVPLCSTEVVGVHSFNEQLQVNFKVI